MVLTWRVGNAQKLSFEWPHTRDLFTQLPWKLIYFIFRLVQVASGNLLALLSRHFQRVSCLKFTDDGSHFLSSGDDNLVMVWKMAR